MTQAEQAFLDATVERHFAQQTYNTAMRRIGTIRYLERLQAEQDDATHDLNDAMKAYERALSAFLAERLGGSTEERA